MCKPCAFSAYSYTNFRCFSKEKQVNGYLRENNKMLSIMEVNAFQCAHEASWMNIKFLSLSLCTRLMKSCKWIWPHLEMILERKYTSAFSWALCHQSLDMCKMFKRSFYLNLYVNLIKIPKHPPANIHTRYQLKSRKIDISCGIHTDSACLG